MARTIDSDRYVELSVIDSGDEPREINNEMPARLHISRDYWIAECPNVPCGYAIVACHDILIMFCPNHGEFDIEWPEDWQEIEKVLDKRPENNRNWLPGETVDDLKQENRSHGVD